MSLHGVWLAVAAHRKGRAMNREEIKGKADANAGTAIKQ
jgi:hypothetical protein